jgi:hypothetical protein
VRIERLSTTSHGEVPDKAPDGPQLSPGRWVPGTPGRRARGGRPVTPGGRGTLARELLIPRGRGRWRRARRARSVCLPAAASRRADRPTRAGPHDWFRQFAFSSEPTRDDPSRRRGRSSWRSPRAPGTSSSMPRPVPDLHLLGGRAWHRRSGGRGGGREERRSDQARRSSGQAPGDSARKQATRNIDPRT